MKRKRRYHHGVVMTRKTVRRRRASLVRNRQSSTRRNFFTRRLDPWKNIRQHNKSYGDFLYEIRFNGTYANVDENHSHEDIAAQVRAGINSYKIAMSRPRKKFYFCCKLRVYVKTEADLMYLRLCDLKPSIIYRLNPAKDRVTLH